MKGVNQFVERHIKLALDDAGKTPSFLSKASELPIDTLKIAQKFISGVAHSSVDRSIATGIISLANNLNMSVIAEGVETEAQMDFLRKQHDVEMQGFLFSKPVPADQMEQLLVC